MESLERLGVVILNECLLQGAVSGCCVLLGRMRKVGRFGRVGHKRRVELEVYNEVVEMTHGRSEDVRIQR